MKDKIIGLFVDCTTCLIALVIGAFLIGGFNVYNAMWFLSIINISGGVIASLFLLLPDDFSMYLYVKNPAPSDKLAWKYKGWGQSYLAFNVACDVVFIVGAYYRNHPVLAACTSVAIAAQWVWVDHLLNIRNQVLSAKEKTK